MQARSIQPPQIRARASVTRRLLAVGDVFTDAARNGGVIVGLIVMGLAMLLFGMLLLALTTGYDLAAAILTGNVEEDSD